LVEALQSVEPIRVTIPKMPVHIQYWTAWVTDEGRLQFSEDIYYRDQDLDVALTEPDYQTEKHLEVASAHSDEENERL